MSSGLVGGFASERKLVGPRTEHRLLFWDFFLRRSIVCIDRANTSASRHHFFEGPSLLQKLSKQTVIRSTMAALTLVVIKNTKKKTYREYLVHCFEFAPLLMCLRVRSAKRLPGRDSLIGIADRTKNDKDNRRFYLTRSTQRLSWPISARRYIGIGGATRKKLSRK